MTQIRFTFNLSEPNYEYVGKKFWVTHKLIDSTENVKVRKHVSISISYKYGEDFLVIERYRF